MKDEDVYIYVVGALSLFMKDENLYIYVVGALS